MPGASPGFGRGGGPRIFFFRFGNLHVAAMRIATYRSYRVFTDNYRSYLSQLQIVAKRVNSKVRSL